MSKALERLGEDRVLVADGGTGALLTAAVPRLRVPEEANLKAPEAVVNVHLGFIRAGAELIEANTFGANRRKLSALLLDDDLEAILEAGVKLAREARDVSGAPVLVAGSIRPLGDAESGPRGEGAFGLFAEQARLLAGRGVDLFMVETFRRVRARDRGRGGAERLVAADRRPAHVRRGGGDARRLVGCGGVRRAARPRRGGDRRELRDRAAGCSGRAPRDELCRGRDTADGAAERRHARAHRRPARVPECDAGLLRGVRR